MCTNEKLIVTYSMFVVRLGCMRIKKHAIDPVSALGWRLVGRKAVGRSERGQ